MEIWQTVWKLNGTILGTWWEHIENKEKNKIPPHCVQPQKKQTKPFEPSHWLHEFSIFKMVCHHFQPRLMHPHYKLGVHIGLVPFYVLICPSLWLPQEHLGSSWSLRHSLMALLLILVPLWGKIGQGSSFGRLSSMWFTPFTKNPKSKTFDNTMMRTTRQTNVALLLPKGSFHIVDGSHYCWHVINLKWHQVCYVNYSIQLQLI
jgi:hypothetical protein